MDRYPSSVQPTDLNDVFLVIDGAQGALRTSLSAFFRGCTYATLKGRKGCTRTG